MEVAHVDVSQRYDLDRPPPASGRRYLTRPGWIRAIWMTALFFGLGFGLVVVLRWWAGWHPIVDWQAIDGGRDPDRGAARVPRRARRVRLLGVLRARQADRAGGPLGPRRALVEGLLPRQHRPQGDRRPVRVDDDLLLPDRRPPGDDHARRAGPARDAVRGQPDLQRSVLRPCLADDLPVRHPGVRRAGELRHPADDRRAGHGVPSPERTVVLAAAGRRIHDAVVVPRSRRAVRGRLDELRDARRSTSRWGTCSSRWASSGPVRPRS